MAKKFGAIDWDSLNKKMDDENQKGQRETKKKHDERFYYPDVDAEGNFKGKIRFLPSHDLVSSPIVKTIKHNFKDKNGYFNQHCLQEVGKFCNVCKFIFDDYKDLRDRAGKEAALSAYRHRFNKESRITNILVLEDSSHEENVGKVFLYRVSATINDKIDDMRTPDGDDPDKQLVHVQDYYDGSTMKLEVYTNAGGYKEYDKCKFLTPSPLYGGDEEKIQEVHEQIYDLSEFVSEDNIKSPEELEILYKKVCGIGESKQVISEEDVISTSSKIDEMIDEDKSQKTKKEDVEITNEDINNSVVESEDDIDDFINMMDD